MLTVLITIHLMIVLALIGVVLLQKSEGGGFVSSTSGFMTGRGTANVLTRATALLAAGFFIMSLALSKWAAHEREPASLIPGGTPAQHAPAPGAPPIVPLNSGNNGLLGQLGGGGGGGNAPSANAPAPPSPSPAAPAPAPAPSGPQVPQSR